MLSHPLFARGLWFVTLACSLGFVAWDATARSRQLADLDGSYGQTVDAPRTDASSPTGYSDGRRSLVLPKGAADTAHWVAHTQAMIAGEGLRIRAAAYDNAPKGREVHWASPFRWWLGLLAMVDSGMSDRPIGASVERAVLLSGPVMLALVLPLAAWLSLRSFAPVAAGLAPLLLVAYHPFYLDFQPGRADHHGLANLACLILVGAFVLGSSPRVSSSRWLIISALAGAFGIWVSAVTVIPVLVGLGMGIVAAAWFTRKHATRLAWSSRPALLQSWARWGAGASLAAYLIEYLPGPFALRLEINHPWYALAWWGAGEALGGTVHALNVGAKSVTQRQWLSTTLGTAALLSLPLALGLTHERTFAVANPFLLDLHRQHIAEFQGILRLLAAQGLSFGVVGILLPPLAVLGVGALLFHRRLSLPDRALLLLAAAPALVVWILGTGQVRWLGLAFAVSLPLLGLGLRGAAELRTLFRHSALAVLGGSIALAFLPGFIGAVQRAQSASAVTTEDIRSLTERDLAHWLRLRAGERTVTLAAAPGATSRLIYFGSHHGLGTLYWENAAGLERLASFYAARTEAEARSAAQAAGLTHIVFLSWDAFEIPLIKLLRHDADPKTLPENAFFVDLLRAPVPPSWLRPLPFPLPAHPALQGAEVRIWEVIAPASPAAATATAIHAYLEAGRPDLASRLGPALEPYPDELPASLARATLAAVARDEQRFLLALNSILAQQNQFPSLQPSDRVHLASVFALGQRFDLARAQLQVLWSGLADDDLRQLSVGQLADLLSLSDALTPDQITAKQRELVLLLLPPARRP